MAVILLVVVVVVVVVDVPALASLAAAFFVDFSLAVSGDLLAAVLFAAASPLAFPLVPEAASTISAGSTPRRAKRSSGSQSRRAPTP